MDSISYGENCGFSGQEPEYRTKMNEYIEIMDTIRLISWLNSPSIVLNAYGVEGLFLLSKKGIKINKETLMIIQKLKNDERSISICSGCFYESKKLKYVLRKFKF